MTKRKDTPAWSQQGGRYVVALLATTLLVLNGAGAFAAELLPGFVEEEIAANWDEAVGIKFGPDGRMFVWQRGGKVYTVDSGIKSVAPVLDISDEVGAWNDYGLIGFALHPNWHSNGYIYLSYVVDRHHLLECNEPAAGVGAAECSTNYDPNVDEYFDATIGRITRYTLVQPNGDPDYRNATTVDYNSRKVLIGVGLADGCPILHISHGIGEILFGTDGSLLAACGDGASANILDPGSATGTHWSTALNDGIIEQKENVGAFRSQMLDSHSGRILRLDPNTGAGLASNPFFDPTATRSARSRTWAFGLRNPFRIELRPGTGSHAMADGDPGVLYLGDVGWNDFEELNVVDAPGQNFGWPIYEGMEQYPNGYPGTLRLNQSEPNPLFGQPGCDTSDDQYFAFQHLLVQDTLDPNVEWPNPCDPQVAIPPSADRFIHTRPRLEWNHDDGLPPRWSSYDGFNAVQQALDVAAPNGETVTGPLFRGNASVGGVWYNGNQYPAHYQNTYFHGDFGDGWIKNMKLDANDQFVRSPQVAIENFIANGGAIVDMAVSPADGMMYYIKWATKVFRVRYLGDGNFPPSALLAADKSYGPSPLTVDFSSAGSSDPENDPLTYLWDFGDGQTSTAANPQHVFDPNGDISTPTMYTVTLTVSDDSGESDQEVFLVSINNTPPNVAITSPQDLAQYSMSGDTAYNMDANISDFEHSGGQLSCEWIVYLHHNVHFHSAPIDTNCSTSTVISPVGCTGESYFYRVRLTVTDAAGLSTYDEVSVFPDCGDVNAPPSAINDSFVVFAGAATTVDVAANDTDDTGLDLSTINIVTQPSVGAITNIDTITGEITYTHNGSATSTDGFSYTISDTQGLASNIANVNLNIVPADDDQPPTIPAQVRVTVSGAQTVSVNWNASTDVGGAGVSGYRIFRDGVDVAFTTSNYFIDQNLTLDTSYDYSVSALDYLNNESAASSVANVTTPAVAGLELRINAGTTSYTDEIGNVWMVDQGFNTGNTSQVPVAILNTGNDLLYQTQRYDTSDAAPELNYTLPLPNALYVVNLHFADITTFTAQVGKRRFDVSLEGQPVLLNYDIYSEVGSYAATNKSFLVEVSDGDLQLDFTWIRNEPIIGAIEVIQFGNLAERVTITAPSDGADVSGPDVTISYSLGGNSANYDAVRFTIDGGTPVDDASLDGSFDVVGLGAGNHVVNAQLLNSGTPLANAEAQDQVSFNVFVPDVDAPGTPANLTANATGTDSVSLAWNASSDTGGSGLAGYRVYRDGVEIADLSATSLDDTGLTPATSYGYTVSAYDNSGNESAQSATVNVTTDVPPPTLTVSAPLDGATFNGPDVDVIYQIAGDPAAYDHLHVSVNGGTPAEDISLSGSVTLTDLPEGSNVIEARLVDAGHTALANAESVATITVTVLPPDTQAPATPAGLIAGQVNASSVALDFADSSDTGGSGLAGYRVYRDGSLVGSPTLSDYVDTGLDPGTTYSYTVSAVDNAGNESAQSAAIDVTTLAGSAWVGSDIGSVAVPGFFSESGGVLTMDGSGRDIWWKVDRIYYVYQPLSGDGQLTARMLSQGNTHEWAKAGVMIRETLTKNSKQSSTILTPGNGAVSIYRPTTGGISYYNQITGIAAPHWVRVVRAGDVISNYISADGQNWTLLDSQTIAMGQDVYIGMVIAAYNDGVYSTVEFDNVSLQSNTVPDTAAPSVPANLAANATGSDSVALSWDASSDTGGAGLAGYRVYRDGAQIAQITGTNYADSGLSADTTYAYSVSAYDHAANESAQSTSVNATTDAPPDLNAPAVPANLAATATGTDSIALSWNASSDTGGSGLAGYRVYRDGTEIADLSATSMNDTGLNPATTYGYTVSAYDNAGNESAQSAVVNATTDTPPDVTAPSVPANLAGSATGTDTIALGWNASSDTESGVAGYRLYRDGAQIADLAATNFGDSGLSPDTTYAYTVSAYDNAGNVSAQSAVVNVTTTATPDETAPDVPANLAANATGSNSVALSWNVSGDTGGSGVAGYRIYRDGAQIAQTAATNFNDSGLSAQTTYGYSVSAYDNAGNVSAQSATVNVTTDPPPDVTAPSVPANLAASATGTESIALSWDTSADSGGSGLAGYRVYRDGVEIADLSATSLDDTGLAPATSYGYTVSAYDNAGNESAQSAVVNATTDTPPDVTAPSVPANLAGNATGTDTIALSWNASSDAESGVAGYRLYRDGAQIADTTATSFGDSGLSADTTYAYTVSAYDNAGNVSAQSAATNVTTDAPPDLTAPSIPQDLSGTPGGDDSVSLNWSASNDAESGVAGYRVYRDGSLVGSPATANFVDTGLSSETTYSYTVSAVDNAGNESAQSAAIDVTTLFASAWVGSDIGSVAVPGFFSESGGVLTMDGSGRDIWWKVDRIYYVYQPLSGDGQLTARMLSQGNTHEWAKAGVMIRETLTKNSKQSSTILTPGNGAVSIYRPTTGGISYFNQITGIAAPHWVRVVRAGDVISNYISADGQNWTLLDSQTIAMGQDVYIGMVIAAYTDGVYSTVEFDNVSLQSNTVPDTAAPSVPANLAANATGSDSVALSWDASSDTGGAGLAGYRVYRDGAQIAQITGTNYADSGLSADTTYAYSVSAYDHAANESAQSTSVNATTDAPPDLNAPAVPANLAATATGTDSIALSWNASSDTGGSGLAGYRVYRDGTEIADLSATSMNDTGLNPATTYGYTVSAYDNAGNESAQSAVVNATTDTPPDVTAPSVPANLAGSATGTDTIALGWNASSDTESGVAGYRLYRDGAQIADLAATNFGDSGLSPDTTYAYTVSAYDNAGNVSAQSAVVNVTTTATPDETAPDVPANLAANATGSNSVALSWNVSGDTGGSGVAGYRIYRDGAQIAQTAATNFNDSGLSAQTTYGYSVSAYDNAGNVSAQSATVNVTTDPPPDVTAPSVPANLAASATGTESIALSWDTSADSGGSGLAGYRVYRDGVEIADLSATSLDDTGLAPATSYGYTVSAYDNAGNESAQSAVVNATTDTPPDVTAPSVPANLAGNATGTDTIALSWNASSDAESGVAGYRLYRDGAQIADTTATSFGDSGLSADTTYAYTVSAYDNAGNVSAQSAATNVTTDAPPDLTAPSIPQDLSGTPGGDDSVSLNWSASNDAESGVAGYRVYRDGSLVGSPATANFVDTGLSSETTYSYTVSAVDNAGNESAQSAAIDVTTLFASAWVGSDIGSVAVPGFFSESGGVLTMDGSGRDIWWKVDRIYYVYQPLSGDGQLTARMLSQGNTHEWAKAGVMIRETLTKNSKQSSTILTPGNGAVSIYRPTTGGISYYNQITGIAAPHWVRVVRAGDVISNYISADGQNWTLLDSQTIAMGQDVYIGMVIAAYNDGVYSTVEFDNVSLTTGANAARGPLQVSR